MTTSKTTRAAKTMEQRLRERILRRVAAGKAKDDAGVALLSALLFMIIMAGLGMVIVSTVLGQVAPTFLAQKETQTVYAAQAGMQAALGLLRTAVYQIGGVTQYDPNGSGVALGNSLLLPCGLKGQVNPSGPADGIGYSVTIAYYDADPTGQNASWLSGASGNHLITCTPGSGVPNLNAHPVKFALLTSTGTGNALPNDSDATDGNRAIGAVYEFKVSTVNIAGGRIYDYNDNGAYCLSAISATIGSKVQFLPASQCISANAALQNWSYGSDYEIKLASTTAGGAAGLCITGPTPAGSTNTQNAILQTCIAKPSVSRWNQLWAWYGSNTWQGANSTITGLSSYNLGFDSPVGTGSLLKVYNGTSNGFSPSPQVGAGAASDTTEEIVNYLEFGRCMDDTNQDVNYGFMISFPCKQDPTNNGSNITWNQKFYYNEVVLPAQTSGPQAIIVNNSTATRPTGTALSSLPSANQYCLITPNYPTTKAVSGALVKLTQCSSTTNYKEWTRVFTVPNNYGASYLFTTTTSSGSLLCLEVNPAITYAGWSELDVAPCVATNLGQKWNAPPNYTSSEVGGYKEIGG